MFINTSTRIYALNAINGEIIWSYLPQNSALARFGGAIGGGLVYSGLKDTHIIALDMQTGKLVWKQFIGDEPPHKRGQLSGALTYVNGIVLSGLSGGDFGARGRVVALNAKTGKEIWRFYTIPAPGESGSETWPQDSDIWKLGGGAVWMHAAVDPDLDLVYFGVGNPVPQWGGELRPGDNLYTDTVIALDLKTGTLHWHYQLVHHDIWDMDLGTPLVLYNINVNGKSQKALAALRTDGYIFILDRKDGKPIYQVEELPVKQDIRQRTSLTQPFPIDSDRLGPECTDPELLPPGFESGCWFDPLYYDMPNRILPGITTRSAPMSYSPQTGYFYVMGSESPLWFRRMANPYYYFWSHIPLSKERGLYAAFDAGTNKIIWEKRTSWALSSGGGALTTAGGLLFHMEGDGNFQAHDSKTGDLLWQFQTGSVSPTPLTIGGGSGPAISYQINGKQYIAAAADRTVYAFALGGNLPSQSPVSLPTERPFSGLVVDLPNDETAEIVVATVLEYSEEHVQDEYALRPQRARINTGTTVKWVNHGIEVHAMTALDGTWRTGNIQPGHFGAVTFNKPGIYTYICTDHPWTYGQIIVTSEDDLKKKETESGLYTELQAIRGKKFYRQNCSNCHGDDLSGRDQATALAGSEFIMRWKDRSISDLLNRIRYTMPQDKPGFLSMDEYLDIVAYLLQANDYPSGSESLDGQLGIKFDH